MKIIFLALSFYFVFGFSNISYFLPIYYSHIGLPSAKDAGMLVSVFYFVSLIARPFMGNVVAAIGFRRVFIIAGAVSVVSSLGVVLSGANFWPAFASRAALGLASALFQIGLGTYQAMAFSKEERGGAFSLIMAGGIAPMMTVVPFSDWLLQRNMNFLYILMPLVMCIGASIVTPSIPGIRETVVKIEGASTWKNPFAGMRACFEIPAFRLALLSTALFSLTDATSSFMSPMTNSFGLMASFFLSSNAVVGVVVRLFFGRVLDRYPRWRLATPATLITSTTLFLAAFSPTQTSLISLGLIFGVGMGFGFPLHLALVSDSVPTRLQPQAVSICWFLLGISFALFPILQGWMGHLIGPVLTFRLVNGAAAIGAVAAGALWVRNGGIEGKKRA